MIEEIILKKEIMTEEIILIEKTITMIIKEIITMAIKETTSNSLITKTGEIIQEGVPNRINLIKNNTITTEITTAKAIINNRIEDNISIIDYLIKILCF